MKREEIEKAIKNGESVWYIFNKELAEIDLSCNFHEIKNNELLTWYDKNSKDYYTHRIKLEDLHKTKAEAEHYLHHANITRTETLPFLTWEEFDKGNRLIRFIGKNGERCKLEGYQNDDTQGGFIDVVVNGTGSHIDYDYTEENFYKAYDECVRLFRGEEKLWKEQYIKEQS